MTATHFDPFRAGTTLTLTEFTTALQANLARILATPAPAVNYDASGECDEETRLRLSRSAQRSQRSAGYGGLRVDEFGRDRDGAWFPQYDGGGQGE